MSDGSRLPRLAGRRATRPTLLRWSLLCAVAEGIGIATAAGAARAAAAIAGGDGRSANLLALSVIVAGGLVEGTALGGLQATALKQWLPALSRGRYVVLTVIVAGLGWAAGSAPATLSQGSTGADAAVAPPLLLVLLGALGLGAVMGAVLGGVQAFALRGAVRHPWRWVTANTVGWPLPMAVIFLGAGTPGADWPTPAVVAVGLVAGACAGALLGLVTGAFLPALAGEPPASPPASGLTRTLRRRGLATGVVGISVRRRVTGRPRQYALQYAADDAGLVVVPPPGDRAWWVRPGEPAMPVALLQDGAWVPALATFLRVGDAEYAAARATFRTRWPWVRLRAGQPLVRVRRADVRESLLPGHG